MSDNGLMHGLIMRQGGSLTCFPRLLEEMIQKIICSGDISVVSGHVYVCRTTKPSFTQSTPSFVFGKVFCHIVLDIFTSETHIRLIINLFM